MAYLVDTSVWVEWLKGQDTPEAGWLGHAIVRDTDIIVPGLVNCSALPEPVSVSGDEALLEELRSTVIFAKPKSRILAWPRPVTKMFAGLMSRCTMLFP